jgi:hypothetical protein
MVKLFGKRENHGIQGMTFGAMDAIINVLGIVVGLGVIGDRVIVVVGLLVAGIANSLGNAAGFHVSEETEGIHTRKEVWLSTMLSFIGTFAVTIILLLPLLFFGLSQAMIISILGGVLIIVLMGMFNSRQQGHGRKEAMSLIFEYLALAFVVIIIAYYLGMFASSMLNGG